MIMYDELSINICLCYGYAKKQVYEYLKEIIKIGE